MKRPLPTYFVAAWCLFGLIITLGGTTRYLKDHLLAGKVDESLLNLLTGFLGILAIWHVIRLAQLKSFNRWFSVVFLGWWTFTLTWNCIAIFSQKPEHPRLLLVFIIPAVLNLASIWFLVRRTFRELSVQFVVEREQERQSRLMQKTAKKSVEHEIRNIRR